MVAIGYKLGDRRVSGQYVDGALLWRANLNRIFSLLCVINNFNLIFIL